MSTHCDANYAGAVYLASQKTNYSCAPTDHVVIRKIARLKEAQFSIALSLRKDNITVDAIVLVSKVKFIHILSYSTYSL